MPTRPLRNRILSLCNDDMMPKAERPTWKIGGSNSHQLFYSAAEYTANDEECDRSDGGRQDHDKPLVRSSGSEVLCILSKVVLRTV